MSRETAQNICFLLYEKNPNPAVWGSLLHECVGCGEGRARHLLDGADLTPDEMDKVTEAFGLADDGLLGSLLHNRGINIYAKNMAYLKTSLDQGEQKTLAESLGVGAVTVSRWFAGIQEPERSRTEALVNFFGLPRGTDLKNDPLFLGRTPIGNKQRRRWLEEHLRKLSPSTLRALYPALERLLKDA